MPWGSWVWASRMASYWASLSVSPPAPPAQARRRRRGFRGRRRSCRRVGLPRHEHLAGGVVVDRVGQVHVEPRQPPGHEQRAGGGVQQLHLAGDVLEAARGVEVQVEHPVPDRAVGEVIVEVAALGHGVDPGIAGVGGADGAPQQQVAVARHPHDGAGVGIGRAAQHGHRLALDLAAVVVALLTDGEGDALVGEVEVLLEHAAHPVGQVLHGSPGHPARGHQHQRHGHRQRRGQQHPRRQVIPLGGVRQREGHGPGDQPRHRRGDGRGLGHAVAEHQHGGQDQYGHGRSRAGRAGRRTAPRTAAPRTPAAPARPAPAGVRLLALRHAAKQGGMARRSAEVGQRPPPPRSASSRRAISAPVSPTAPARRHRRQRRRQPYASAARRA